MRKKLRQELAEFLELPLDVTLNLPRVIVVGHLGVLVSNHRGLISYSPGRLVIGVGQGQMTVTGQDLQIEEVGREEMVIRGVIRSIQMDI